jgi:hypothetical protein
MKLLSTIFAVSTLALASMSASAQLISTDWKNTGDKLATLDQSTGLEWLDLTQTDGVSINQVLSLMDSTYAGWRFPTPIEVNALIENSFGVSAPDLGERISTWGRQPSTEIEFFRTVFGVVKTDYTYRGSLGLTLNDSDGVVLSGMQTRSEGDLLALYNQFTNGFTKSTANKEYGVFLVSDGGTTQSSLNDPSINIASANVPLPATAALLSLGLLGFVGRRKKT